MKKRRPSQADERRDARTVNQHIEHENAMDEDGLAEAEAKIPTGHSAVNVADATKSAPKQSLNRRLR